MQRQQSLSDLSIQRHTRSKGPAPVTPLHPIRRKGPNTKDTKSTSTISKDTVRHFTPIHIIDTVPILQTIATTTLPATPNRVEPIVNMAGDDAVELERQKELETRIAKQLEAQLATTKAELERLKNDLEKYNEKSQNEQSICDLASAISKANKQHIREPAKFSKPDIKMSTKKWFGDLERYVRIMYPKGGHPLHVTCAYFLAGPAYEWYRMQPVSTQDDYDLIKKGLIHHFKDLENDIKLLTLTSFDPTLHTMEEWLKDANTHFQNKGVDVEAAIIQVATILNEDYREAIRVESPTTWAALSKALRSAYLYKKGPSHKLSAMSGESTDPALAAKIREQDRELSKLRDILLKQQEVMETEHTVAAMGGGKPKPTYHKHTATPPHQSPSADFSLPPNYRGRREDYDINFVPNIKKARALGLIPPTHRFKGGPKDIINLLQTGSLPPQHFVLIQSPQQHQQRWQPQQQQQQWPQQQQQQQWPQQQQQLQLQPTPQNPTPQYTMAQLVTMMSDLSKTTGN